MTPLPIPLGASILVLSTLAVVDASWRAGRRFWPGDPLAALAATAVLVTSAVTVLLEVLGVAGLLGPWWMLGGSVALWLGARLALGTPHGLPAHLAARPSRLPEPALLAVLVAGAVLATPVVAQVLASLTQPHPVFDASASHLPVIVQWLHAGDIRFVPNISPVEAEARYPGDSELLGLWFVLPLHRDFLVQAANLIWLPLLGLGAALAARELGSRWPGRLAAAIVVPAIPLVLGILVGANMTDLLLAASVAGALGFVALAQREPRQPTLVAAGLCAGLAIGSRYAGLIAMLPIAVVVVAAWVARRVSLATVIRRGAVVALAAAATGLFWYVRNAVVTGDPVFPQSIPGHTVVSPETEAFQLFGSYATLGFSPRAWGLFVEATVRSGGPLFTVLTLGGVLPVALAAWRRERSLMAWAWALLPLMQLTAFLVLPLSAGPLVDGHADLVGVTRNLRYLLPTTVTTTVVLAAELRRLPPRIDACLVAVALVAGAAALLTVSFPQPPSRAFLALAAGALVTAVVAAPLATPRRLGAGLAAAAVAFVAAAPALQRHYDARRAPLPFETAAEHLSGDAVTVDAAGFCQVYALYGPTLQREVEYLSGADDGIIRPRATTYDQWIASMRSHGVTQLVVATDTCFRGTHVPQAGWASEHPAVFRVRYRDAVVVVYDVTYQV